jgi:hypothetical protein
MSITHKYTMTLADASLTGFASNVTGAAFTISTNATSDGLAHQVSIRNDSATDHAAKTAVITGTDADGRAQTETVNLPGTSATIESTKYFKTVTSVVPSATIGSDTMDIGWVDEAVSPTIMLNRWKDTGAFITVDIGGTLSYSIEVSNAERSETSSQEDFFFVPTATSALVTKTADALGTIEAHATAARVKLASYSSGATLVCRVSESGV